MNEEFKKLNEKYNDDTYEEFPYIAPYRITLLKKGLYRKKNAKYRGVTAVYDNDQEKFRFYLYGMYNIPEDIVIVPDDVEMTEKKQEFLDAAIQAGYKKVNRPPKFEPVEFPANSEEAKLALANKAEYHRNKLSSDDNKIIII